MSRGEWVPLSLWEGEGPGCTATSVPGRLAQGPVVRACLWEADGEHWRLVCSAVAGPLLPRAQLGCTEAGSAALRGRCRPRT